MRSYALLAAAALPLVAPARHRPVVADFPIVATDFAYTIPASVPAGVVRVSLTNRGKEIHHAQLARLNDGVTWMKFDSALARAVDESKTQGDAAFMQLFSLGDLAGGPASVSPGKSTSVTLNLVPGTYEVLCFVPGQDGAAHVTKGMVAHFTVSGTSTAAATQPAGAAGTVEMADFAYPQIPGLKAGKVTVEVVNHGKEPHEFGVMRPVGISADQLIQILTTPPKPGSKPPAGPPPFEAVGGMQGLMPGQKGWATLDLTPGDYVAICMIPSPANQGKPHSALGMVRKFTVT